MRNNATISLVAVLRVVHLGLTFSTGHLFVSLRSSVWLFELLNSMFDTNAGLIRPLLISVARSGSLKRVATLLGLWCSLVSENDCAFVPWFSPCHLTNAEGFVSRRTSGVKQGSYLSVDRFLFLYRQCSLGAIPSFACKV